MNASKSARIVIFCFVFSIFTQAQKNEISLSVGALTTFQNAGPNPAFSCILGGICAALGSSTSTGVALEGNYARRLINFRAASLDLELPVLGAPARDDKLFLSNGLPGSISTWTLFFTPSARIKLFPSGPVAPFFSVGGGLAHAGSAFTIPTITILGGTGSGFSFSRGENSGALQFGGGADFRTPLPHLAVRVELRDFWAPNFANPSGSNVGISSQRVHNLFAAGGLVLRF